MTKIKWNEASANDVKMRVEEVHQSLLIVSLKYYIDLIKWKYVNWNGLTAIARRNSKTGNMKEKERDSDSVWEKEREKAINQVVVICAKVIISQTTTKEWREVTHIMLIWQSGESASSKY